MKSFVTNNYEETISLGERLIFALPPSLHVILLEGDLSAGKTTFTKGIGKALHVKSMINSPTFTILKVHHGDKTLYHLDLYRLHEVGNDFDLEEYIEDQEAVTVIEWPHQVEALLPKNYVLVKLTWLSENARKIDISSTEVDTSWEDAL